MSSPPSNVNSYHMFPKSVIRALTILGKYAKVRVYDMGLESLLPCRTSGQMLYKGIGVNGGKVPPTARDRGDATRA